MDMIMITTTADAAAMIRAALPKEQKEERVFVLPLDANGKVLAKPILVSVGQQTWLCVNGRANGLVVQAGTDPAKRL